jgi:predicted nucleotidyltransferase component of viral defense system
MKNSPYYKQAELLLKILPIINKDEALALKGGTAINFFVRDLPRLSVDIDLVYLPLEDRDTTFKNLTGKLKSIKEEIVTQFQNTKVAGWID